jgi:hypothetical protein
VLQEFFDGLGEAGAMWRDPETAQLLGNMPMRSLLSFSGATDIQGTIADLLKQAG